MLALLVATAINPHATVTLRAPEFFGRDGRNEVILDFQIQPEWHIYWQNPGDSGEEPRAIWTPSAGGVSGGVSVGALEYPIPERLEAGPFTNFGFSARKRGVPLRVPVQIQGDAEAANLAVSLTYLVCKESCVPEKAELAIRVPIEKNAEAKGDLLARFGDVRFPKQVGVGSKNSPLRASYRIFSETVHLDVPTSWQDVEKIEFFPLVNPAFRAGDPGSVVEVEGEELRALAVAVDESVSIENLPDTFVGLLVDRKQDRAEWIEYTSEYATKSRFASAVDFTGLLRLLGLAFIGGLLLNLMPCVFPVVSLKVLSFVREGRGEPREVRRHAYAYTAGIVLSLWALVAVLLSVRAAGAVVGWGFQLQQPVFLFILFAVFFVLGLNLLGAFAINYAGPANLQNLLMKRGLAGSFFTGLLTTLVATPCSAPFMGVAIGSALAGGATDAFMVFTALAIGLASPYLVLAFVPRWIEHLPRPGAWMERLKEFLAFPLFATAVWLVWVMSQTVSSGALVTILLWCVAFGFFAWALRLKSAASGVARLVSPMLKLISMIALLVVSFLTVVTIQSETSDVATEHGQPAASEVWAPYSDARLKTELAAGHAVFIDFTASWCVTCQVNKKLVLSTEAANSLFQDRKVVRLRADWTKRDAEITNALSRLGRNSVPVYAFYRATGNVDSSEPVVPILLPEILTFDILKNSLEEK